jgi:spore coat polysaccharide biosynthesis predicted glycosyltransferase SpsG
MNNKKIVFRVDVSREIGGGHLSRALAQIKYLSKRGIKCSIILKGQETLQCDQIEVIRIPEEINYSNEVEYLRLKKIQAELCVVDFVGDHNLFYKDEVKIMVSDYQRLFQKLAFFDGVGIGAMYDDLEDLVNVDLLIRPYATAEDLTTARLLSGFQYYIYPNEYYQLVSFKKKQIEDLSITISFGRSDPNHLTEKILSALDRLNFFNASKVTVVIGDMFLGERIERINNQYLEKVTLIIHPNSLKEYFNQSSIIICGTGLTKYEACLFEGVVIVCSGSEADFNLQEQFQSLGLSYHLGPIIKKSHYEVGESLSLFISDPRCIRNKRLSPGNGLALICDRYEEIFT